MPFDFSKLTPQPKEPRLTDPIALFQRLRVTDPSINDLWLAQGDALRAWHDRRTDLDVSISLNTGAGKTLVGLLIGQSLVNELRTLLLYACSSIQLVEQTAKKAAGYGLPVTTYVRGQFSNDLASRGEAVCLTTYQALFNGRSVLPRREIGGIVFDDAHAAEHLLRDHFSLRISRARFENEFKEISAEFADYYHSIGLASSFQEVTAGTGHRVLLVPPFEIRKAHSAILRCLQKSEVPAETETTFAWEHLKDHIDLCAFLISPSDITITPPFVPVRTLSYFRTGIRRVYLSATLSAMDVFVRTFGRKPSTQIAPKTTAGECERMILTPAKMQDVKDDIAIAASAVKSYKTLILVPSYPRAAKWSPHAVPPLVEKATEAIETFKTARGVQKLLLAARYDGMDFPGDTCRVIIIDDLPSGIGPLERYLWEYLGSSNTLRSAVASRIVQSFGRISRGMSDHGIVLLTGKRLVEWLQVPKNVASLPLFLQKQLQLGNQMSSSMAATDIESVMAGCLKREAGWIDAYEKFIREAQHEEIAPEPATMVELAASEARYAEDLWQRNFQRAASHLQRTLEAAGDFSVSTVSWHKLWLAYALDLSGDAETAAALYRQAHGGQRNIPPFQSEIGIGAAAGVSEQAVNAARQFEHVGDGRIRIPRTFERELLYLDGSGTTNQTEEALRSLGQYLGFTATRPDSEFGTGPDVLWIFADKSAFCLDAKSGKEPISVYRKKELGQLSDHVQWVRDSTQVTDIVPAFVGPVVPCSESANPSPGVKVISLAKLQSISETLKAAYRDIAATALPLTLAQVVSDEFAKRELLWPVLEATMELVELRDLK
jgi:hypothetical protein